MPHKIAKIGDSTKEQIDSAFATIPAGETILDLSRGSLSKKKGEELAYVATKISESIASSSIVSVNLSSNDLDALPVGDLMMLLASCKGTSLDLADNSFHRKVVFNRECEELATIFSALSSCLTSLNLRANFGILQPVSWIGIFASFRPNITELYIDEADIFGMQEKDLATIGKALPYVTTIHVLNEYSQRIESPKLDILRSHIGKGWIPWAQEADQILQQNLPHVVSQLTLSYLELGGFFKSKKDNSQTSKLETLPSYQ